MKTLKDINGKDIHRGNSVDVPEPNETDIHSQEFTGTVTGFRGENLMVEDSGGDTFEIEANRVTLSEE